MFKFTSKLPYAAEDIHSYVEDIATLSSGDGEYTAEIHAMRAVLLHMLERNKRAGE